MSKMMLKRFPIVMFCTLTVLLSFASYFASVPREALPFVFVLIPTAVALVDMVALSRSRRPLAPAT